MSRTKPNTQHTAMRTPGDKLPPPGVKPIIPPNYLPQSKQTKRCANCKFFTPFPEQIIKESNEQIEHMKLKNSAQEYDLGIEYKEEDNEDDLVLLPYHGVCRLNPLQPTLTTDIDPETKEIFNEIVFEETRTRKNYYCSHHQLGEYEGPPYEDFAKED